MSLGSAGRLVLDEMIYDPSTGQGESSFSLMSGAFSFVSGQIAKSDPDGMQIKTPVATIGIRGTSGTVKIGDLHTDGDAQLQVVLIPDPSGTVGEIIVTTSDGRTSTLNAAFNGLNVGQVAFQSFTVTASDFVREYGAVIQSLRSDFSNSLPAINNDGPADHGPQDQPQNGEPAPEEGDQESSDTSGADPTDSAAADGQGDDNQQNANGNDQAANGAENQGNDEPIKVVIEDSTSNSKSSSNALGQTVSGTGQGNGHGGGTSGSNGATNSGSDQNNSDNGLNHGKETDNSLGNTTIGGGEQTAGGGASVSYGGKVIDPYVSGATIFIDYDNDQVLDSDEPWTISGSDGSYSLTDSSGRSGQIVSIGGVDTETGLSVGTMIAPNGATVVTPLTTLMQQMVASGGASSVADAQAKLATALGLDVNGLDVTKTDPIAVINEGGNGANQAATLLSTAVLVQNVASMISATLKGAGASGAAASEAAFSALASALTSQSGRSFLQDPQAVSGIISDAANNPAVSGSVDAAKVEAAQNAVATTIGNLSASMESIISAGNSEALLADLSAAARVAQRDAQANIESAVSQGTADSLTTTYSSSAIDGLLASAKSEEVAAGGPTIGTSGADTLVGTDGVDEIYGRESDDLISGGAGNDRLYGEGGNDTLIGGAGNDTLSGGSGTDTADYSAISADLSVNLANETATSSESGNDILRSIERVIAGSGNDTLIGSSQAEILQGGAGNDTFVTGGGADAILGGTGVDVLDASAETGAVSINLAVGSFTIGGATGTLSGVEVALGGAGDDTLTAATGSTIDGGAGNDRLIGAAGAALIGGAGLDTADFSAQSVALIADLAKGTFSLDSLTGSLSGIEVLRGGAGADHLTGSAAVDSLFGGDGADTLIGGGGSDLLDGGAGDDRLTYSGSETIVGGTGTDRLVLSSGTGLSLAAVAGSTVSGIEVIDLSAIGSSLTVTADAVTALGGELSYLVIDGASSSSLTLSGDWTAGSSVTFEGTSYTSYTSGDATVLVGDSFSLPETEEPTGSYSGQIANHSGKAFIGGQYIELGIDSGGYLGASGAPDSFHTQDPSGLSMVSSEAGFDDPSGTISGDYFLPGTPIEGYSIGYRTTAGGSSSSHAGTYSNHSALSGTTVAAIDGATMTATTTASLSGGAMDVTQVITLDSQATYYTTTITLTNTSDGTLYDVRYLRNADPDQDVNMGGDFETFNDVLGQVGTDGVAAVQSTGMSSGISMAYFSDADGAVGSNDGFNNTNPYDPGLNGTVADNNGSSGDSGINMLISGGDIGAGESVTLSFVTTLNVATKGHDYLIGAENGDSLSGLAGNDILWGLGGADTLSGGSGDDQLNGGAGNDILTGGEGADLFRFTNGVGETVAEKAAFLGSDLITDFNGAEDTLVFDGQTFNASSILDYVEQNTALTDAATAVGSGGAGVIMIGADSGGGGVEVWFTEDTSAASTANSYQIATLAGNDLSGVSASNVQVVDPQAVAVLT
jgi:Ca2+-binding RTX toxin-like protein